MYLASLTVPLAKVTEMLWSVSLMLVSRCLLPVMWLDAPESKSQSWSQLTAEQLSHRETSLPLSEETSRRGREVRLLQVQPSANPLHLLAPRMVWNLSPARLIKQMPARPRLSTKKVASRGQNLIDKGC